VERHAIKLPSEVTAVGKTGLVRSFYVAMPIRFVLLPLILFLACSHRTVGHAEDSVRRPKTVKLLTVGNSFSHNATHYLGDLAKAAGHTLILREAIIGGSSFEVHWLKHEKNENDPKDPAGLYGTGLGLRDELRSQPWDYITIQQASIKSHDLDTYQPFAGKLHAFIKEHAPKAEILLHQTWEYRCDDPRFSVKEPKPGEPATQEAMYQGLKNAYAAIAKELKVQIIPVGNAFHLADSDAQWGYKPDSGFDIKNAKSPDSPDQKHSLHIGWSWKKQKDDSMKLGMDGHHASLAGEYLGACVWYEVLFKDSIVGNVFIPKGLAAEDAKFLQQTAHRAVATVAEPVAR